MFRHILASLHFNENIHRETKLSKDGEKYYAVTYPKFKLGEEVVREVASPPTYGRLHDKSMLFTNVFPSNISNSRHSVSGNLIKHCNEFMIYLHLSSQTTKTKGNQGNEIMKFSVH